jgi:hypothetical protein
VAVLRTPIRKIPLDFSSSDGILVYEMIANLSGKTAFQGGTTPVKGTKMQNLKTVLQYLEGLREIVTAVKPEFLLGKTDFCNVMKEKIQKQLLGID